MKWAPIVHIYQPPFQNQEIVKKAINESYLNIIDVLKRNKQIKINLNISGSLTEKLIEGGHKKIIDDFKKLAEKGQIEFLASAMYHPILPLIPEYEIERQIELNYNINRRHFNKIYKPRGFFPPELAISYKVAKILEKKGFSWFVVDETAIEREKIEQPLQVNSLRILSFFRQKKETNALKKPTKFLKILKRKNKDRITVTARDGELWGHNFKNGHKFFEKIATHPLIKTVFLSEIINDLKNEPKTFRPKASYWFNDEKKVEVRGPYPLWSDPQNKIHKQMWRLTRLAIRIVDLASKDNKEYKNARKSLDQGLSSCSFWWANPGEWWHPDVIIAGMDLLIRAIRSVGKLDPKRRYQAEKIFLGIQKEVWRTHWLKIN